MARRTLGGRKLGGLQAELLELLWAAEHPLGVRELLDLLPGRRRAYTTVITVLTRLVDQGLVERVGDGRRYVYRASADPDQLTARAIEALLEGAQDRRAVLAHLLSNANDPSLLAELARVLKEASR